MVSVFLGGTCSDSQWREKLIRKVDNPNLDMYNPVVPDWTPEVQAEEIKRRAESDYCLFVITPLMQGVFSIAEVVDDSNKRPEKTLFLVKPFDEKPESEVLVGYNTHNEKSLKAVGEMVRRNGARWFETEDELVAFLNGL